MPLIPGIRGITPPKTGRRWFRRKEAAQDNALPERKGGYEKVPQGLLHSARVALIILDRDETGVVEKVNFWLKPEDSEKAPVRRTLPYKPGMLVDEEV